MGQRRLKNPQNDDQSRRQHGGNNNNYSNSNNGNNSRHKSDNTVLNNTTIRKGEVFRAQRRTSDNVNQQASQHLINVPVNKSVYNGLGGQQFSLNMQPKRPKGSRPVLRVIPLGGLGEMGIGKNMMAIEYDNDIIVCDMGFLFPGADYPGINYITPDISYLEENKHKIRGHVFTHGHLDHIGAFRHLVHKIPAPAYSTRFTIGMLQRMMEDSDSGYEPDYRPLDPDAHETVNLGDSFQVELVRVNHSIPDATAVVIRTPVGVLVDSGDWRFEDDPVDGKKFDLTRLTEIAAKEGILLLMNESTSCEFIKGDNTHSEFDIQRSVGQIMEGYANNRLIISCFSSQLHRIQIILDEAKRHDRKVAFAGYSMIQNLEVALRTGVIKIPKDVVCKMEDIIRMPDGKVTIVCTGSQGEFNAVLNRMASGAHKHIKIKSSDIVVFSSNPIPGNEKYVVRTVDGLMREGSEVIQNGKTHLASVAAHSGPDGQSTEIGPLHLSGHGYYEDHVKFITALNPTYYMPIHGEFHMLVHNAELAEKECSIPRNNIFVCDVGDVLEIDHDGAKKAGRVPVGGTMYDDSGAVVSDIVLKDRIHMATEGMFVVVLTVSKKNGRLLTSPDIISRGFIYLRDSEELMGLIRQYLKQKVGRSFGPGKRIDLDIVKKEIKDELTHILYDQTRRTPIVIPVINEIGGDGQGQGDAERGGRGQDRRPNRPPQHQDQPSGADGDVQQLPPRHFPPKQVPDTEVIEPRLRPRGSAY